MIWYVVRNGEVLLTGTQEECYEIIEKDMTGELEIYSERARVK